jgi:undecaprenyl-diphosphatase
MPQEAASAVARFDHAADAAFDRLRGNPAADRLFYTATSMGDFSLVWLILGALRGLRSERDWHAAVRLGLGMGAESVLVNALIKSAFQRRRPAWDLERPRRVRRPRTSSFPSGHATSAFSAAVLLSEDDALWPLYFAVAVIVASSRVYVRIHHASDVAAGAVLGVGLGLVGRRLAPLPPAPSVLPEVAG